MADAQPVAKDSWREPPPTRSVLVAAGLADQTASAAAHLEDASRSHAVTRAILPDGRGYVVKQLPGGAHAAGRSLKAELYTYRLASWRNDLAALLPVCVHLDERRQIVVTHAAPAHQLFPARIGDPLFPQPEIGAALGRALALLHAATADLPTVTVANCGVIALPDTPAEQRRLSDDSPSGKQAIARVCDDDDICDMLRATAASFSPSCLIHGDVKWDNMIIDDGPPPKVLLFDWELSGRGDPAWDLGSALADTLALPTRSVDAGGATPGLGGRNRTGNTDRICWRGPGCRNGLRRTGGGMLGCALGAPGARMRRGDRGRLQPRSQRVTRCGEITCTAI